MASSPIQRLSSANLQFAWNQLTRQARETTTVDSFILQSHIMRRPAAVRSTVNHPPQIAPTGAQRRQFVPTGDDYTIPDLSFFLPSDPVAGAG
jgi:hypothetical protein